MVKAIDATSISDKWHVNNYPNNTNNRTKQTYIYIYITGRYQRETKQLKKQATQTNVNFVFTTNEFTKCR